MAEQTVLVAIDIGTTKVCVLIGEMAARGGVDVIGIGQAASDGLRKGVVIDIDRTVQSVAAAVDAAERLSGLKVRSAFVGISGMHVGSQNSRGMIAVSGRQHDVTREDTLRAIEAARAVSIPNTREILHVIPRGYVVDGQEGVRDPIGMSAVRLEVEAHIVTASSSSVTSDLGLLLRVTPDVAETLKIKQGTALPLEVDPDEVMQITSIGEEVPRPITRRHMAQIIEARTAELFDHVAREIEAAGATNRLQAGVVLTGGGALLTGIARAARDQLGMAARVMSPTGLGGLTDSIAAPPYSASSGLLIWGAKNWSADEDDVAARSLDGVGGRLSRLFRSLMP